MTIESPYAARLGEIPVERYEVEVLGSTTRYWVYGAHNATEHDAIAQDPIAHDASRTVVAVHGYRGEHHGLEPVVAHLRNVRIVSPDLPGFGESTPLTQADHSIQGYAAWLGAFLEELGLDDSAVILGHSFGTIVSASAIAGGLRTPALILVNPIAISGLDGPRPFATWVTVRFYRLAARLPHRLGEALLRNWLVVHFMSVSLAKTKDRVLRKWIHREHHTFFNRFSDRDTAVEAFEASISADVSVFARDIRVPTLLVAAELDDITPVSAQYELQRLLPDARLRVLPGVGHLIHYEVPELAAAAINDFIDGLAGA